MTVINVPDVTNHEAVSFFNHFPAHLQEDEFFFVFFLILFNLPLVVKVSHIKELSLIQSTPKRT